MRKIPIYGPGAGNPGVGEGGNPLYTVAISDELGRNNVEKAKQEKMAKRWDYHDPGRYDPSTRNGAATALSYYLGDDPFSETLPTSSEQSTRDQSTLSRMQSTRTTGAESGIREMRGVLNRGSTRGRRKVGTYPTARVHELGGGGGPRFSAQRHST